MSASDIDERECQADVARYAPPRHRAPPDEATILPILERLSRGQSGAVAGARAAEPAPPGEPIRTPRAPSAPRLPLSATGRLAVAVGAAAAVAAVSVTVLQSKADHKAPTEAVKTPSASSESSAKQTPVKDQAKLQSTDLPRTVHTVTIRPQMTAAQTMTAQSTPVVGTRPAPGGNTAKTLPAALKTWAMFPDTAIADASHPATTDGSTTEHAKAPEHAKEAAAPHHTAKPKRTARRARRHRIRHRRVRTAAKPQAQRQAQATQTSPTATEPVKKTPIQAAIDSIFGNLGVGDSGASGGSNAPMTTGAAFR